LINNDLVEKMHKISVSDVSEIRCDQLNELISQIDKFDENAAKLDKRCDALRNHNSELDDNMPFLDDQIKFLKDEIEKMNSMEITADAIIEETFKPKDELS
jgi:prefoldin subunit 5